MSHANDGRGKPQGDRREMACFSSCMASPRRKGVEILQTSNERCIHSRCLSQPSLLPSYGDSRVECFVFSQRDTVRFRGKTNGRRERRVWTNFIELLLFFAAEYPYVSTARTYCYITPGLLARLPAVGQCVLCPVAIDLLSNKVRTAYIDLIYYTSETASPRFPQRSCRRKRHPKAQGC